LSLRFTPGTFISSTGYSSTYFAKLFGNAGRFRAVCDGTVEAAINDKITATNTLFMIIDREA
jgi:hypothetical protein